MKILMTLVVFFIGTQAIAEPQEKWIGTAPFCDGNPSDCTDIGWEYIRSSDSGDGASCWRGEKVLCKSKPNLAPKIWLGTAPICEATQNDCGIFGMNYEKSSSTGNGSRCVSGNKVQCSAPSKKENNKRADSNRSLNVLTYNIYDRPFLVSHDGQVERTCRIPTVIAEKIANHDNIDVLVIEEAFTKGCWENTDLRTLLAYYGWPYATNNVDGNSLKSNGGVFIASKWPIKQSKSTVFTSCDKTDCLASKGVMYAEISKQVNPQENAMNYHIFGTHLQAWEGEAKAATRLKQAKEIQKIISQKQISNEAVIIAGDLNIDNIGNKAEVNHVLKALYAKMPAIIGDIQFTANPKTNTLDEDADQNPKWLDYVTYSSAHLQPIESSVQVYQLQTSHAFEICTNAKLQPHYVYPTSSSCFKTMMTNDLSDHYPVLGRFKF